MESDGWKFTQMDLRDGMTASAQGLYCKTKWQYLAGYRGARSSIWMPGLPWSDESECTSKSSVSSQSLTAIDVRILR